MLKFSLKTSILLFLSLFIFLYHVKTVEAVTCTTTGPRAINNATNSSCIVAETNCCSGITADSYCTLEPTCSDYSSSINQATGQCTATCSKSQTCSWTCSGSQTCGSTPGTCSGGGGTATPTPTPECTSNADCSGYSCSGCTKIPQVCSSGKCVAGTSGSPNNDCSATACTSKICSGCKEFNASCNSSGQCQANSALGAGVASGNCNNFCTGTWVCSGSGATCGQTCNSAGNCQNNSATCPGGSCPNVTPVPTLTPTPTPTPTPGTCTSGIWCGTQCCATGQECNAGNTACVDPVSASCSSCVQHPVAGGGVVCQTITTTGSCTTDCSLCSSQPPPCDPNYYENSIDPTNRIDQYDGQNGYLVVSSTGRSYFSVRSKNHCDGYVNISNVANGGFSGTGIKPVIGTCAPLPDSKPYCPVDGNSAPIGKYDTRLTLTKRGTTAGNQPSLIVYVRNPKNLSYTCSAGTGSATNLTFSWPEFTTPTGKTADRYCLYIDGVKSSCKNNTPGKTPSITLLDMKGGTYTFQIFGWYTGNSDQWGEFADQIAEATLTTSKGTCKVPDYFVSGNVWVDLPGGNNKDGVQDPNESYYTGTFTVTSSSTNKKTNGSESYYLGKIPDGNTTISLTTPNGYTQTYPAPGNPNSFSVNVGGNCTLGGSQTARCDQSGNILDLNFGIKAATYTISGNVFVDNDSDLTYDTGEGYGGSISITAKPRTYDQELEQYVDGTPVNFTGNGPSFSFTNLTAGTYKVDYNNPPIDQGYIVVTPVNGPPPFRTVTLGPSASNLNFGININSSAWIQSTGGNIRIDSGINNQIPSNADPLCGGPTGYMSLPGNGGDPGIIYSGDNSADFGNGQASSTNWVVSQPDGEPYNPPTPNTIRTAYGYIEANAGQQGLTLNDLAPYCSGGLGNCTIANLPTGIYKTTGNLTLNAFNVQAGRNIIILVGPDSSGTPGNLTLRGNIDVPSGSTAIFSASGDIYVDSSVGEVSNTSPNPNIEGIFSADKDFIVRGTNNCSVGPDRRLNVEGNLISNAALLGGSFSYQRNLCAGNTCPSVSIVQRLDLIINLPPLLRAPNYIWKEVAP